MAVDEKTIIEQVENESEGLKAYASFLSSNEEYRYKKQQRRLIFLTFSLIIYLVFVLGFLFIFRNNASLLFWPLRIFEQDQNIGLEVRVGVLEEKIKELRSSLATSSTENININDLNNRIGSIEETIELNPEKALTAVLLREKQKNLDENFVDLRNAQVRLESKVDGFVTTVLVTPIVAALLGLLGWFLKNLYSKRRDE